MEKLVKEIHKIESSNLPKYSEHLAEDFRIKSVQRIEANLGLAETLRKLKYRMTSQIPSEEIRLQYLEFPFYVEWKKKFASEVQESLSDLVLYTKNLESADLLETQIMKTIKEEMRYFDLLKTDLNLPVDSRECIPELIQKRQKSCQSLIEEKLKRVFFKLFPSNREPIIDDHKELVDLYKKIDELNKLIGFDEKFLNPEIILEGLLTELQKTMERRGQMDMKELGTIYVLKKKLPGNKVTLQKIIDFMIKTI